jgi:serine O-acetyltransferase
MLKNLREYLTSVFQRDPAARSVFELLTVYPGVHALALHRLSHRLWRWRLRWLARVLAQVARWLTGIEIHPGAKIGRRFFIDHGMGVVIGETAEIGDDCTLYHGVTLGGTTWRKEKRHPTLGNNVVVGAGAKILGPITVGDNARVGSNSVVVKDVPAGATVIGIPGRVIGPKKQDTKSQLREAMAKKIGFDAYGQSPEMPDPVAQAIDLMLDHMHVVDNKMKILSSALEKAGIKVNLEMPQLEVSNLEESPPASYPQRDTPKENS